MSTDFDLRSELHAMYAAYVDTYVGRRLDRREGDATNEEIHAWAQQAHDKWVAAYPAAHAYRFHNDGEGK